jgi:hypothetical protein
MVAVAIPVAAPVIAAIIAPAIVPPAIVIMPVVPAAIIAAIMVAPAIIVAAVTIAPVIIAVPVIVAAFPATAVPIAAVAIPVVGGPIALVALFATPFALPAGLRLGFRLTPAAITAPFIAATAAPIRLRLRCGLLFGRGLLPAAPVAASSFTPPTITVGTLIHAPFAAPVALRRGLRGGLIDTARLAAPAITA